MLWDNSTHKVISNSKAMWLSTVKNNFLKNETENQILSECISGKKKYYFFLLSRYNSANLKIFWLRKIDFFFQMKQLMK